MSDAEKVNKKKHDLTHEEYIQAAECILRLDSATFSEIQST